MRRAVIEKLIAKIEVHGQGFRFHFYVGGDYIERELALDSNSAPQRADGGLKSMTPLENSDSKIICLYSLQNGGPERIRTSDLRIRSATL